MPERSRRGARLPWVAASGQDSGWRRGADAARRSPPGARAARAARVAPGRLEAPEVLAPAFGARAVAGGERGRFIEEEQLGVASRRHDRHKPGVLKRIGSENETE